MNILAPIGRVFLAFLAQTGALTRFMISAVTNCVRPPIYWGLIGQQMIRIGYFSLPVVGLTAFFTGGALALQIYVGTNRYGASPSCRTGRAVASCASWVRSSPA